jgi:hypothetical protein
VNSILFRRVNFLPPTPTKAEMSVFGVNKTAKAKLNFSATISYNQIFSQLLAGHE